MSRKFEFRAWDKKDKRMVYEDTYCCDMAILFDGKVWCHDSYYEIRNENFELLQYTGLYDRNGTKIFEGDIVRFERKEEFVGEVWWQSSAAYFAIDWSHGEIPEHDILMKHHLQLEVIGNVYENPELLFAYKNKGEIK